jgi:hypothetical protein
MIREKLYIKVSHITWVSLASLEWLRQGACKKNVQVLSFTEENSAGLQSARESCNNHGDRRAKLKHVDSVKFTSLSLQGLLSTGRRLLVVSLITNLQ